MTRIKQTYEDTAEGEDGGNGTRYDFLYVDQDSFGKHAPQTLADLPTFDEASVREAVLNAICHDRAGRPPDQAAAGFLPLRCP